MKFILVNLLFVLCLYSGYAQNKQHLDSKMSEAFELYENNLFFPSYQKFKSILDEDSSLDESVKSEIEAYMLMSSIILKKPNLEALVNKYIITYPFSEYITRIRYMYASYYFEKQNFGKALSIYNQIDNLHLSKIEIQTYIYNKAFCNLRVGKYENAKMGFQKILSFKPNTYTSSSKYYKGYIYYIYKDFDNAIKFFDELVEDNTYSINSRYFLLESYFMKANHNYVVDKGPEVFKIIDGDYKNKVARMLSESYFELGDKRKAKDYLDIYSRSGKNLSRKDNYFFGLVSYSLGAYFSAIDAFVKVASVSDTLTQSANYHLGNSFLKIKNKYKAMEAFQKASSVTFNVDIQEESFFKYAKLLFDINSDIRGFNSYLATFTSSEKSDEIHNYIATSFLLTKKYQGAIDALLKIKKLQPQMQHNLQKASFFRGVEYFKLGAYSSSIKSFQTSIDNGTYNKNLKNIANFWMAEAYYRIENYDMSVKLINDLISLDSFKSSNEYPLSLYNQGYSYFGKHDYNSSIEWFNKFLSLSSENNPINIEAKTRVADSYFMLKDYEMSSKLFSDISIIEFGEDKIYANYYAAVSYGLLSKYSKKIDMLEDVIVNKAESVLYTQSIYELGRTYMEVDNMSKAIECFNKIVNSQKDSLYYSKTYLELGLAYSTLKNEDKALDYFDRVITEYKLSREAVDALAGVEAIYVSNNRPEEFLDYLEKIGMSDVKTSSEKELMLFNACEQIFLSGNYIACIDRIDNFIKEYPDASKTAHAYFYKGESLKNLGRNESALIEYEKVLELGEGSFKELAALYYAEISYSLEKYDDAIKAYLILDEVAILENNKLQSKFGLMKSYFKNKNYIDAISTSEFIVNSSFNLNETLIEECNYISAKSFYLSGNRVKAIELFKLVSNDPMSEYGAEARYLLIMDAYDSGDFTKVEELVYAFSDTSTPQLYWLAKSFIALGDSFMDREDLEQAKATFISIRDEYEPVNETDDIITQIEMRLNKLNEIKKDE